LAALPLGVNLAWHPKMLSCNLLLMPSAARRSASDGAVPEEASGSQAMIGNSRPTPSRQGPAPAYPPCAPGAQKQICAQPIEPAAYAGIMRKQCSHRVRKRWTQRHFLLKAGCLHWSSQEVPVERPSDLLQRKCMDFSRTRCEVTASTDGHITICPEAGVAWYSEDRHNRAGMSVPFRLRLQLSATEPDEDWLRRFQEHVTYGQVSREFKAREQMLRRFASMGLRFVPSFQCDGSAATCSVCLDALECEGVVQTSCGHYFHDTCVDEWTSRRAICPMCRAAFGGPW